jgi:hypothetical protein
MVYMKVARIPVKPRLTATALVVVFVTATPPGSMQASLLVANTTISSKPDL